MVLYHTVSTYHILRSILHRLNYHPDEEAVLLAPSFFPKIPYGLKDDHHNLIFEKVIYYDWEYKRYDNYPQDVFDQIECTLNKKIGKGWQNLISEYNVFYAARFFGAYLVTNGVKMNWFEEADGRYLNPYPPMEDDERLYPERFVLAKSLGLYTAENDLIQNIYLSLSANRGLEIKENIINFEVNEELKKLSDTDRKKLLEFWNVEPMKTVIDKHSVLLMSQHFCNIKAISFEEQVLLYQMTVDYFLMEYKIYLKQHPSDLFPYKEFIDGVITLDADYPSELLQYSCNGKFEVAAAISSTGIMNLRNISNRQLLLNEDYLVSFKHNDLYYFACVVLKTISEYDAVAIGVNERQFRVMIEYGLELNFNLDFITELRHKGYKNKIVIIGPAFDWKISEDVGEEICKDNIIILLSVKGALNEFEFLRKNKVLVKRIKTYSVRSSKEKLLTEKAVFIAANCQEILERVNHMEYEKLLSNTKIKIRVDADIDKDIQISTLMGMLDETEKALENCVEENQRLRAELEIHSEK